MASEIKTAFDRGRDELANALKAFPDSIPQSAAQAQEAERQAAAQVHVQAVQVNQEVHMHKEREI